MNNDVLEFAKNMWMNEKDVPHRVIRNGEETNYSFSIIYSDGAVGFYNFELKMFMYKKIISKSLRQKRGSFHWTYFPCKSDPVDWLKKIDVHNQ